MDRRSALATMVAAIAVAGCGGGGGGGGGSSSQNVEAAPAGPIPAPPAPAPAPAPGPAPVVFDYHLDSVHGNDGNDGRSPATAFATVSRLNIALGGNYSGQRIGLARGSYWREQIGSISNTSANVVIGAYGSGALPVLDAADRVGAASWNKTAAYANVYDQAWAHDAARGSTLSAWEDGKRLRWVASIAACDATPGSFYAATIAGSTTPIYIHPTSGDPNASGKVYEVSRRDFGLCVGSGGSAWQVSNLRTKRQAHNDGSLVLAASGSRADGCLAEDGTKHNLFIGADCEAANCVAWKCDWADRTNSTLFVAYTDAGAGKKARFSGCIAICDPAVGAAAVALAQGINGFYAHTAGASSWGAIELVDCAVSGCAEGMSAGDAAVLTITRPRVDDCNMGVRSAAAAALVTDAYITQGANIPYVSGYDHVAGNVEIDGLREYSTSGSTRGSVFTNGTGSVYVHNSVMVRGPSSSPGFRMMVNGNAAGTSITSRRNIVYTQPAIGSNGYRAVGAGLADLNVYFPGSIDMEAGGVNYADFTTYKVAQTVFDQGSVAADPLLNNPAAGDFGCSASSPAAALQAGLTRPSVSYTAIPTAAQLAAL